MIDGNCKGECEELGGGFEFHKKGCPQADKVAPPETGVPGVVRTIQRHADYRSADPEATSRLALIRGLTEALLEHFERES